ncbi:MULTISPECIES: helix-turn-helix domain-containing protein [Euryhalocaulis]|uniref:helix-turn-helix domain-containing protein n=1 Tax=Euryhalocaulis TaxID=1712422 RepID=UPI0003A67210|nr:MULTISPECIES: helix-turn-helix transcriptional regulator [Euryhalocaulis]MBA4801183.1 helix-turn-helix transcriptional regulator [Euryhalocaulis sp.]
MTKTKGPNPVDKHVGSRVRLRRKIMNMSQESLGEALGVTFQQVQKYERGVNRIGASRLYAVSHVLEVPVGFFFEGLEAPDAVTGMAEGEQQPLMYDFIQSTDGVALASAFSKIQDPKVRRRVIELIRALSDEDDESGDA